MPRALKLCSLFCQQWCWKIGKIDTNTITKCRGRLVQWENVRLPIQQSGCASCLRQMDFSFAVATNVRHRLIQKIIFSGKIVQRHLLERKSGLQFSLCTERVLFPEKIGPAERWSATLYNSESLSNEKNRICNLQQYQLTKLNLRRSASVDWTRPRTMEGPHNNTKK